MFSSVWLFFFLFTCTFLNVFNQHLSTHALHTQLHTSTPISTHKLQNAPAVSSVLCVTFQTPHVSCLLKSVSLFLPFKFFDSVAASSWFFVRFPFSLLIFVSVWLASLPPGGVYSSQDSPLPLDSRCCYCSTCTNHRPSFLPLHSASHAAQVLPPIPSPSLLTHSLLLFLFHYLFSAICWKLQIMMYTVNSNAL